MELIAVVAAVWIAATVLIVSLVSAASRGDRQLSEGPPPRRAHLRIHPAIERRRAAHGPTSSLPWLGGRRSTDLPRR